MFTTTPTETDPGPEKVTQDAAGSDIETILRLSKELRGMPISDSEEVNLQREEKRQKLLNLLDLDPFDGADID